MSASLQEIVTYCDQRVRRKQIADFPGAENGLQCENDGKIHAIGAAVDAGLVPFREAVANGFQLLIVHHGMLWQPPTPAVDVHYEKFKTLIEGNLAVYSSHLPLDAHPEIGNNAILAQKLGLEIENYFLEHEGTPIAALAKHNDHRDALRNKLHTLFGNAFHAIEYGSESPDKIGILTGSGASAIPRLKQAGTDTLITGELKQHHFNIAQEHELNLYVCGHYATETFGVCALAAEISEKFSIPWQFIKTECPL